MMITVMMETLPAICSSPAAYAEISHSHRIQGYTITARRKITQHSNMSRKKTMIYNKRQQQDTPTLFYKKFIRLIQIQTYTTKTTASEPVDMK